MIFSSPVLKRGVQFYSRLFLGIIFVMASLGKVTDPKGFALLVSDYQILPQFLIMPFSYLMPWIELTCGILLIFGYQIRIAGTIVSAMLLSFIFAVGISLMRGLDIDCGCFDIPLFGSNKIGLHVLIRNIIFFLFALSLVFFKNNSTEENH